MIDLIYASDRDIKNSRKKLSVVDSFFPYIHLVFRFSSCIYPESNNPKKFYNLVSLVSRPKFWHRSSLSILWSPNGSNIDIYVTYKGNSIDSGKKYSYIRKMSSVLGEDYSHKTYTKIYSVPTGQLNKLLIECESIDVPNSKKTITYLILKSLDDPDNHFIIWSEKLHKSFLITPKNLVLGESSEDLPYEHNLLIEANQDTD